MIQKIVTIGVYGSNESLFFDSLSRAKVDTFCDIRLHRGMRGSKFSYVNSAYLQNKLSEMNIRYLHLKHLAPSKEIRLLQKADDKKTGTEKRTRTSLGRTFVEEYQKRNLANLDIIVTNQRLLGMQPDLRAFLQARVAPHPGNPARLYDGMIRFTGAGSGYISADAGVPGYSTCYWLPDRQLRRADDYFVYRYENGRTVRFKYVGYQNVQELIPAGTLLRMSLARWWTPDNDPDFEQRCYVQLSGWF